MIPRPLLNFPDLVLMTPARPPRVKICGITRPEDGRLAARLGADAIGLVFHAASPRWVDAATARQIIAVLPPFVTVVGLFRNEPPEQVRAILAAVPVPLLQFHGDEEPEVCAAFGLPYIKAVPMGAGAEVEEYEQRFATATALLLDSHGGDQMGGAGRTFNWNRIPVQRRKPLILAGGLRPDNVAAAIRQVQPYAVDVSSGVESAKGVKDAGLMRAFLQEAYRATGHGADGYDARYV